MTSLGRSLGLLWWGLTVLVSAALVGSWPSFHGGTAEHGRWLLTPANPIRNIRRQYRDATLVLETEFETDSGVVTLVDFMPQRTRTPDVVRIVECKRGHVPMKMDLIIRFDYGSIVPWVRRADGDTSRPGRRETSPGRRPAARPNPATGCG